MSSYNKKSRLRATWCGASLAILAMAAYCALLGLADAITS